MTHSPPHDRSRPGEKAASAKSSLAGDSLTSVPTSKAEMLLGEQQAAWCRRQTVKRERALMRRLAKSFLEPEDAPCEPSAYWMDSESLIAYSKRLRAAGWQDWEIRARLTDPREVAA